METRDQMIQKACGCAPSEVTEVEETMRDVVFHSTLDWQTRQQLVAGARQAYKLMKQQA